jgi:hypothetical protein
VSATRLAVTGTMNDVPANPAGVNNSRHNAGTVTISASSSGAEISWYSAATGGTALHTGNSYTPSITGSTTYYAEAKITATGCISAGRTAVTATMLTKPANPTGIGNTRCGSGTVTISATTTSSGAEIDWYSEATGGSSLYTGNSYTPTITESTTYYAEARYTSSGEVSEARTPVEAIVIVVPLPTITVVSTSSNKFAPATFTATGGSGSYLWKGAFEGRTGAIQYTTTTPGVYTAYAVSYVQLPTLTCYSSNSTNYAGYVYGNAAIGATCSIYLDCSSNHCTCNRCVEENAQCSGNYAYYTPWSRTAACASGWTRNAGCSRLPFAATISMSRCNGVTSGCSRNTQGEYRFTCNTSTGAVTNAYTEPCWHCCDDRLCENYYICYKKVK